MDSLVKAKKQVVVMVVSSTGEGDPPDNSARFYGHSKYASLHPNTVSVPVPAHTGVTHALKQRPAPCSSASVGEHCQIHLCCQHTRLMQDLVNAVWQLDHCLCKGTMQRVWVALHVQPYQQFLRTVFALLLSYLGICVNMRPQNMLS